MSDPVITTRIREDEKLSQEWGRLQAQSKWIVRGLAITHVMEVARVSRAAAELLLEEAVRSDQIEERTGELSRANLFKIWPVPGEEMRSPTPPAVVPGQKPGQISPKARAAVLALEILNDPTQRPPEKRGRLSALVRIVLPRLQMEGFSHQQSWAEKHIRPTLREWEGLNPDV